MSKNDKVNILIETLKEIAESSDCNWSATIANRALQEYAAMVEEEKLDAEIEEGNQNV